MGAIATARTAAAVNRLRRVPLFPCFHVYLFPCLLSLGDNIMTLEERLDADLKDAMKSNDTTRKLAIRAVKTAITEAKVAGTEVKTVTDADVLAIITKQVKQRRDSIIEYNKAAVPTWPPRNRRKSPCWRSTCPSSSARRRSVSALRP